MIQKCWLAWCVALMCPLASGVELVRDINNQPQTAYTGGSGFANALQTSGGVLFFTQDLGHGIEPWITDGTPGGTRLLKDIRPGPISSDISMLTMLNGVAYFFADDGTNGYEMWRSDGTVDGTHILANIGPGSASGAAGTRVEGGSFPVINGVIYFAGNDGTTGGELWRTDGTANGTYRVADGNRGSAGSEPNNFCILGSRLYFIATDSGGEELWTSDGTQAGTRRVADIWPGPQSSHVGYMTVVGDVIFFQAFDDTHGNELWRVNASGNAGLVEDLATNPAGLDSNPKPLAVLGDSLLFYVNGMRLMRVSANSGSPTLVANLPGEEIRRVIATPNGALIGIYDRLSGDLPVLFTDGTVSGTHFSDSELRIATTTGIEDQVGNSVYFYASVGSGPANIWRTDGTPANTVQYVTIDAPVVAGPIVELGGKLYFTNGRFTDPDHGSEMWVTDGTSAGTHLFLDTTPGPDHGLFGAAVFGSRMFLDVFDGQSSFEPWVSDGTEANTTRLADLTASFVTGNSGPTMFGSAGSNALFYAHDGQNGTELWASNGTSAGTRNLHDVTDGDGIDTSAWFVQMNGYVFFAGVDDAGAELWRTDGTLAGTYMVKDINAGPDGSYLRLYDSAVMNGVAYFLADDGVHGTELWRSDGTSAGTWLVVDLEPGEAPSVVTLFQGSANGRIFLRASAGDVALVYSTDGTEAGTLLVLDTLNISGNHEFEFQDRMCFNVIVINTGFTDYYCSDGTPGNVERITDFQSLGLSPTSEPYVLNGLLLLSGYQTGGLGGGGIYACDGTPNGITRISELHFSGGGMLLDGGARLAFSVNEGVPDIIVTDGTAAGTRSMLAGTAVVRSTILGPMAALADSVVFVVNDPEKGPVTWKTDGTVAGTRFLFDVDPVAISLDRPPAGFTQVGNRMFFSAFRTGVGDELFTFTTTQPNATDDSAETAFNTSISIPVAANDADFDSSLAGATIEVVTPPVSGTLSVDSGGGNITYTPNSGFSGFDTFVYRIIDTQGNASNGANVSVTTKSAPSNTNPGTAPIPPGNPNPPSGGGGGGGGGALGWEILLLAWLAVARVMRGRGRFVLTIP